MSTILRLQNLTKHFGPLTAVDHLSFAIEEGHVYGILGPNGSGKSTTLGMILNVINKTSGDFQWFEGKYSTHEALKKVGAIIEHPNFYPNMTAEENLKLVCKIKNISPGQKIDQALKTVGLFSRRDSKFSAFSLGMKQRLAIASALLNDPKILILDEPTNGLDPQGIHQIRTIIHNIAKTGTTILLASHLLDEVEKICSHVVIIRKGKKLYAGSVDALNADYGYVELEADDSQKLKQFLKQGKDFGKISQDEESGHLTAILKAPISATAINQRCFKAGIVLSHLNKRRASLETRFLEMTNN